jgi:hypothetical protein
MAIAATAVSNAAHRCGNKKQRVYDLVFSGNYATGGETVAASVFGLTKIEQIVGNGNLATSTDLATANPVGFRIAASGTSVTVTQYEGSAAGTALSEKTNAEAYATGSNVRVTAVGF